MDGVRQAQSEDVPGIVALQAACFPPPFPTDQLWRPEHIEKHLEVFPEGQLVAVTGDQVIGSASALVVSEEIWQAHLSWEETTGGFYFLGHDHAGTTLYGADISVHPDWRGRGVGRELYRARFELVRRLWLVRYGTTCRIPDFASWRVGLPDGYACSQESYCSLVAGGELVDRTMTPLLKMGLMYVGVVHGNMQDAESGNAAAILEWTP